MRLFTHDIKSSIAIPQLRDYLLESDIRIKGLHDYIEHTNPNYILINENNFFSSDELAANKILNIGLCTDKDKPTAHIILRPNFLKLHRGLLQKYGNDAYCCFGDIDNRYINIPDDEAAKAAISELQNKYFTLPINKIISFSMDDTSSKEIVLINKENEVLKEYDFLLYHDTTAFTPILTNNQSYEEITIEPTTDSLTFHHIDEGTAIIANLIEEDTLPNLYSKQRCELNNYYFLPTVSSLNSYLPVSLSKESNGKLFWNWEYIQNAINIYGKSVVINLNLSPMRLLIHKQNESFIIGGMPLGNKYKLDYYNPSQTILSYLVQNNTIVPQIANNQKTVYSPLNKEVILQQLNTNRNNTFEEVFFDEEIKTGTTNFDKYYIPFYNITIQNLLKKEVIPQFSTYLTIA